MNPILGVALNMGAGAWIATVISVVGFVVMFGIASAKGDYQGLAKTTLANDKLRREQRMDK